MSETFKKHERITSEITIENLFKGNMSVFEFPFKAFYGFDLYTPQKGKLEMAIAVPKKRLKHANDRNYIKRLVREAFRRNKQDLTLSLESAGRKMSVFFVYVGTADTKPDQVQEKIIVILKRLQRLSESNVIEGK